jgi:hypothetical protein
MDVPACGQTVKLTANLSILGHAVDAFISEMLLDRQAFNTLASVRSLS